MAKFYISHGIDGKKPFIVAVIKGAAVSFNRLNLLFGNGNISKEISGRGDYKHADGIKLSWVGLLDRHGEPLISPRTIVARFNVLKKLGFEIIDTEFRAKHFGKKIATRAY